MDDRTNTISMMVLGATIVALGTTIVFGEVFSAERPEKMGYPIEGVVEEGEGGAAEAEKPIAFYLASADVAKGENVFKKCTACHSIEAGGAAGIGPNIHGIMGQPIAKRAGFAYSGALSGKGGAWDWDAMNAWLLAPKKFASGTKMTFAGLSSPEDRANVLAYLNAQGSNLPIPAAPEGQASPDAGDDNAASTPGTGQGDGVQKAENEPVPTEQQVAKQPQGNVGGEGAPAITGTSKQERESDRDAQ